MWKHQELLRQVCEKEKEATDKEAEIWSFEQLIDMGEENIYTFGSKILAQGRRRGEAERLKTEHEVKVSTLAESLATCKREKAN